jgi:hypothetical protein
MLRYTHPNGSGGQALYSPSWHRTLTPALDTITGLTRHPCLVFEAAWPAQLPPGRIAPRPKVSGAHKSFAVGAPRNDLRYPH